MTLTHVQVRYETKGGGIVGCFFRASKFDSELLDVFERQPGRVRIRARNGLIIANAVACLAGPVGTHIAIAAIDHVSPSEIDVWMVKPLGNNAEAGFNAVLFLEDAC